MSPTQLSIHEVNRVLKYYPPDLSDIAVELRSIVLTAAPGATERVFGPGFSYYYAEKGGPVKAAICGISIHEDHVQLSFIQGAFLPDPQDLLEGDRKYKRFVKIESYETAPWSDLKDLIEAAEAFDWTEGI